MLSICEEREKLRGKGLAREDLSSTEGTVRKDFVKVYLVLTDTCTSLLSWNDSKRAVMVGRVNNTCFKNNYKSAFT